jgi:hypothetical protein
MPDFGRWSPNGGDPSLNEINRTDRFLDALASQQPVYSTDPSEAELAQLLAGWRDEVRTPPLMSPVTPRDAVVALTRAVDARKRTRTSMAVVGGVAAAVLCLGGFGAVVAGAGPGDALYGLHTMLFGEQQTRTDQVALASQQLAEVQQLIDQGRWDAAQDKLQTITTTVATVDDVGQKQELVTQWQDLTVKVDAKDPNATLPPGVPPPVMPEPVVVEPGSTTPSTSPSTSSSESSSETATSSSETTSSPTTSSPPSSSPAPEPPPPSDTPTTTTTPNTTTTQTTTRTTTQTTTTTPTTTATTTTTTHTVTTPTTTSQAAGPPAGGGAPAVGGGAPVGGGAQVVAPPTTVTSEAPRQRASESPVTQSPVTQNPVTTTTLVMPPPKKQGNGE